MRRRLAVREVGLGERFALFRDVRHEQHEIVVAFIHALVHVARALDARVSVTAR